MDWLQTDGDGWRRGGGWFREQVILGLWKTALFLKICRTRFAQTAAFSGITQSPTAQELLSSLQSTRHPFAIHPLGVQILNKMNSCVYLFWVN